MSATQQDMTMLEELCDLLKHTSLCGLGQSAPNPVVSTLRSFAEEYRAHIDDHKCPAGVCGRQENGEQHEFGHKRQDAEDRWPGPERPPGRNYSGCRPSEWNFHPSPL